METYQRKSVFTDLKEFDFHYKDGDYIEVTKWYNGEGFDIDLSTSCGGKVSLTWGQFKALKKAVKKLDR